MSSLQALDAKVARLEAELESERDKNKEQGQRVKDLAAKLARRDETLRSLRRFMIAASQNFARGFQQIDCEIEAKGGPEEHHSRRKLTRKVPITDNDKFGELDRSFDAVELAKDHTTESEKEEPSVQTFEAKESSQQIEEDVEETDKDKRHDPTLMPLSNTFVSPQPALSSLIAESEPTLPAPNILFWPHPMRCALMFKVGKSSRGPIGDPFQAMNGWEVRLNVAAGLHGRPTINLHFKINTGRKDAPVSQNRDHRTEFTLTWFTGVANHGHPMIRNLEAHVASKSPPSKVHHFDPLANKLSGDRQQDLTKLVAVTFKSNSMEKPLFSATTRKPWKGLPIDVQQCLDILFFYDKPLWMTIWFCADSDPEVAMPAWLLAVQRAVEQS